jgi:CDP-glycerol glycerophosphotransferase
MKVSVIIPFHRGIFFLEDALQSLREQSYRDFEVLLVCNNATEELEPLLNRYHKELDIKSYRLSDRKGVAAARNYGLKLAQGEYVYFLDSDDYLSEESLELLVAAAEREKADLTYGTMRRTWFSRSTFLANLDKYTVEAGDKDDEDDSDGDEEGSEAAEKEEDFVLDPRSLAYRKLISEQKGAWNISVLHLLIRKALINEYSVSFWEDLVYLSDYPFVFLLLLKGESFAFVPEAYYMKRNHNDPIRYPSLSQMGGSKDLQEYADTCLYTISLISTDGELRKRLYRILLHDYTGYYAPKLRTTGADDIRIKQFEVMHGLVSAMDRQLLRSEKGYRRKLVQALVKGDLRRTVALVNRRHIIKRLKTILRHRKELVKFCYLHFFLKKSTKESWVFCESFFGKSYSDSPKYIYEYLSVHAPGKYRFIWVVDRRASRIPYMHTRVKRYSLRYCYYLARSKYYVFNGRQPEWTVKRSGNVFLQTWHGTPLKRLVFDQEDVSSATARYKLQVYHQSRAWDYLIAPNPYSGEIFRRCFLYGKVMLETGYPRNDILHAVDSGERSRRIKERIRLPSGKKTLLYAPTWRDDEYYSKGRYKFSLQLNLRQMKDRLGEDYVLLLRTHYFIADRLDIRGLEDFVYNVSSYDDIAELYLISDVLITDYSSVFFDYANLKRPMLFFMYDLLKYRDILRGFYIDIEEELPGPILSTSEEVVKAIERLDSIREEYQDKYDSFYVKYCGWEDGGSTQRVVEAVFGKTDI